MKPVRRSTVGNALTLTIPSTNTTETMPQTNQTVRGDSTRIHLTAVFIERVENKRVTAYFAEMPQVIAEGQTKQEAEKQLVEALRFMLEIEREEEEQNRMGDQLHTTTKEMEFELV